jgi:hypothetical protein
VSTSRNSAPLGIDQLTFSDLRRTIPITHIILLLSRINAFFHHVQLVKHLYNFFHDEWHLAIVNSGPSITAFDACFERKSAEREEETDFSFLHKRPVAF